MRRVGSRSSAFGACVAAVLGLALAAAGGCGNPPRPEPPSNHTTGIAAPAPAHGPGRPTFTAHLVAGGANAGAGAIQGVILDGANEPIIGATIVATSPAMRGEVPVICDEHGRFAMPNLPPGHYTLTFYYGDATHAEELDVAAGMTAQTRLAG
ncbi:MAG TPA: carboxypeptidase-like regulatory domain-containing protein [Kofleriaceae bacterium]|nr:carboxypeptidase-like regulatory domain-containing protein [Kofleriaceae bacterium]